MQQDRKKFSFALYIDELAAEPARTRIMATKQATPSNGPSTKTRYQTSGREAKPFLLCWMQNVHAPAAQLARQAHKTPQRRARVTCSAFILPPNV